MLILLIGAACLLLLGLSIRKIRSDNQFVSDGWWLGVVFASILLAVLLITVSVVWGHNGASIARWQAFRDYNSQNFQSTITQTEGLLSTEAFQGSLVAGSVEKWQQAGFVSERLKEWRDAINSYNSTIASMRYVRGNWMLGGVFVIPPISESLQPFRIGP